MTLSKITQGHFLQHRGTATQGDGSIGNTGGRFYRVDRLNDICYNFIEVMGYAKITKTKKR